MENVHKIKLNQSGHCVADVCHSPRAAARLSNSHSERKFFVFTPTLDRTERGLDMLNPWFGWFHSFLQIGGVFGLSLAVTCSCGFPSGATPCIEYVTELNWILSDSIEAKKRDRHLPRIN